MGGGARQARLLLAALALLLVACIAVENHDRHSALGDSVATAEVFVKMIDVLAARGICNLGQALEASDRVQAIKGLQEGF